MAINRQNFLGIVRGQTGGWNSCATIIESEARGDCRVPGTILKRASFRILRP